MNFASTNRFFVLTQAANNAPKRKEIKKFYINLFKTSARVEEIYTGWGG